jgi:hypothetical protein
LNIPPNKKPTRRCKFSKNYKIRLDKSWGGPIEEGGEMKDK